MIESRCKGNSFKLNLKKMLATITSLVLAGTLALSPALANDEPVLEQTGFGDVYASSFFSSSYAVPVMMAGLAVTAGGAAVFTTMTAGTGAPAAVAGVGTVAAWVGGNVPGAYMIGLTTIGGYFGGNAVLGAAILNGAMATVIATTGGSIVGTTIAGTTYLLDGFNYLKQKETNELVYLTTLKLAPETGSDSTRDAVGRIIELESQVMSIAVEVAAKEEELAIHKESLGNPSEDGYAVAQIIDSLNNEIEDLRIDQLNLVGQLESLKASQVDALEHILGQDRRSHRQEDILSLSLIAWNEHRYDLFHRAISALTPDVSDTSFYHYLRALSAIANSDPEQADRELADAMLAGPYALEPVILRAIILGEDFERNEHRLDELAFFARNHFDSNEYQTSLTLPSLYFRLASIYFQNERYEQAKTYFSEAHDKLGVLQRNSVIGRTGLVNQEISRLIQTNIANSEYMLGNIEKANELMNEITKRMDDRERATFMGLYEGSFHR